MEVSFYYNFSNKYIKNARYRSLGRFAALRLVPLMQTLGINRIMLKVTFGKIDCPFTKNNLVKVLNEGKSGNETNVSDEIIANWCYEFYLSYNEYLDEQGKLFPTKLAKEVALDVSGQWEADVSNTNGRVLSSNQYSEWLTKLGAKNA